MTTGHCKHGEFNLMAGCKACIAEREVAELAEKVKVKLAGESNIVKVQYYSETTGELSPREYTYYSTDRLSVGDIVIVPVRDTTGKAKVGSVDVSVEEIAAFKDRVKTIPAGAKVAESRQVVLAEDMAQCSHGLFIVNMCPECIAETEAEAKAEGEVNYGLGGKGANTYLDRSTDEMEEEEDVGAEATTTEKAWERLESKGSPIRPEQEEMEAGLNSEGLTLASYPQLDVMTDLELGELYHEVADSKDPTDIDFKKAIQAKLKKRHIAACKAVALAAKTAVALRPREDMPTVATGDSSYPETALIMVEPMKDQAVTALLDEVTKSVAYAERVEIVNAEAYKSVTNDLTLIRGLKKKVTALQKEYLDPINAHMTSIRDAFKTLLEPLDRADKAISGKMLAYNAEIERVRREQEEINRKRQEAAEQEMKLKGELTEPVGLVEVDREAPRLVRSDIGAAGMKANWKYRIINLALLPREYMIPDDAMLKSIAKSHHNQKSVEGVEFYNAPFMATYK